MNTLMNYQYRDASNYKMHNEVVLKGEITDNQIDEIMDCLNDYDDTEEYGYFIPAQIGLEEKRFDEITEDDHPWFELGPGDFETTDRDDYTRTVDELIQRFKDIGSDGWSEDSSDLACQMDDAKISENNDISTSNGVSLEDFMYDVAFYKKNLEWTKAVFTTICLYEHVEADTMRSDEMLNNLWRICKDYDLSETKDYQDDGWAMANKNESYCDPVREGFENYMLEMII